MPPEEQNWKDNLPDDLKNHTSLQDVKDVPGLAKQFVDTLSAQGQMIRIPGEDAGDDARKAFYDKLQDRVPGLIPTPNPKDPDAMNALFKRMGRPEDHTGYEHPEGIDASKMADFAAVAHANGLTKAQYKGILSSLVEATTQKSEAAQAAFNEAQRNLKREWGIVYEDNLQLVDAVMKGTGAPKQLLEVAADGKLDPETTKWLYAIGKQLGTEGINFDNKQQTTRLSPSEAQAQIDEIMNDDAGPYWNSGHPRHAAMVKKVVDLRRAIAAGDL